MPDLLFSIRGDTEQLPGDFSKANAAVKLGTGQIKTEVAATFGSLSSTVSKEISTIKSTASADVFHGFSSALSQIASQGSATFQALASGFSQIGHQLTGVINPLSLATAGFGAFINIGLAAAQEQERLIQKAIEAGSRINDLSIKTGLYAETLSGLDTQLTQSGTSLEKLSDGVFFLQKNLLSAAEGNDKLKVAFARLGIKDATSALTDMDGTLRQVVKGLIATGDAGTRNALGAQVMGRAYKELSVFIADTGGDIDAVVEKARAAGLVMSGEAASAADRLGDAYDKLRKQSAGLERQWTEKMFPAVEEGLDIFNAILIRNKKNMDEWADTATRTGNVANWFAKLALGIRDEDLQEARRDRMADAVTTSARTAAHVDENGNLFGEDSPAEQIKRFAAEAKSKTAELQKDLKAASDARLELARTEADKARRLYEDGLAKEKHDFDLGLQTRAQYLEAVKVLEDAYLNSRKARVEAERAELQTQEENEAKRAAKSAALTEQLAQAQGDRDKKLQSLREQANQKEEERQAKHLENLAKKAEIQDQARIDRELFLAEAGRQTYLKAEENIIVIIASRYTEQEKQLQEAIKAETVGTVRYAELTEQYGILQEKAAAFKEEAEKRKRRAALETQELEQRIAKEATETMNAQLGRAAGLKPNQLATQAGGGFWGDQDIDSMIGKPPDLSEHMTVIGTFKDYALDAWGSISQGFGSMIESFLMGERLSGKAFMTMAKSAIAAVAAEAAVRALFELAMGLASLWLNPPAAAAHFLAAKTFGLVAGVAAVTSLAIPGGGGSAAGNAIQGSTNSQQGSNQQREPRTIEVDRRRSESPLDINVKLQVESNDSHIVRAIVQNYRQSGDIRTVITQDGMMAAP